MSWLSPRPSRTPAAAARFTCCCAGRVEIREDKQSPSFQPPRIRIELAVQPARRGERKAQGQGAAPGRGERGEGAMAQQRRAKRVRHYEATFFGDEEGGKLVRHSEIEPVRELPIKGPFTIGAEIGHRAFDLDYHQVAGLAERQDVGAAAVGEREFAKARIAELLERAANASRQQNRSGGL